MEVIGFFTTFNKSVCRTSAIPCGAEVSSAACASVRVIGEQFTCDDRDHSAEQCVEQVKADNGADDASVALLCLAEGTDNKEKIRAGARCPLMR